MTISVDMIEHQIFICSLLPRAYSVEFETSNINVLLVQQCSIQDSSKRICIFPFFATVLFRTKTPNGAVPNMHGTQVAKFQNNPSKKRKFCIRSNTVLKDYGKDGKDDYSKDWKKASICINWMLVTSDKYLVLKLNLSELEISRNSSGRRFLWQ